MEADFSTLRRWLGYLSAWLFNRLYWPGASTRVQQRSLLRLILVAGEQNIPLGQLIEAWADDESGAQSGRLLRLATLLKDGTPLADAIEEVRSVISDEDVLAVRFGVQSGSLAATIGDQLDQPVSPLEYGSPRVRHLFSYFSVVVLVSVVIVTFFMIKIVPALNQIFEEFNIDSPESLQWSVRFANVVSDYWYLFALALLALWLLLFTSLPGRRLRMRLTSQFYRPARELRFASVLQNLSVATRAGRPIAGALSTLARYHFDPILRNQLLFIRNELDHGAGVWECMGNLGLLTIPEVRALESSERIGDRAWVLQQLAQGKRRRLRWRFARWLELVLPAFVLLLGTFVLWQALSMFQSLVKLVYSLL